MVKKLPVNKLFNIVFVTGLFFASFVEAADLTYDVLAVKLAKGLFWRNVSQDASMEECAVFLNSQGICFSLFDLIDPDKKVTKEDLARVLGQSMLVFSGEAVVVDGCVKKPLEAQTWVDYCLLNDIDSSKIWGEFVQSTTDASLTVDQGGY